MPDKKKLPIISPHELMSLPLLPSEWVIDNLLRTRRPRISLLVGKPEAGKSTLARQLAVSIAKGITFLGRRCLRADVLYWQTEDDPHDVKQSFLQLGYDPKKDAGIWTFNGDLSENTYKNLEATLTQHPEIKLVIIETIDDLMRIEEIRGNTQIRQSFEQFYAMVLCRHYERVSFLGLHHFKKRENEDRGDQILGGTYIRGKTDAKIYLDSKGDGRRFVEATVRRGVSIPKTYLDYDPETERSTLGTPLALDYRNEAQKTLERIEQEILGYVRANPKCTVDDCLGAVSANTTKKRQVFNKLAASGSLQKQGNGKKNDPFVYMIAEIKDELPLSDAIEKGTVYDIPEQFGDIAA